MSETFIKIDSLQHLEISSQTYPSNRSKSNFFKLMRTIHASMTRTFQCELIVNVLHSKDAINSN